VLNGDFAGRRKSGVTIEEATAVNIEHCTIHDFPQRGIAIPPGGSVDVFVTDSTVRDGLYVFNGRAARLTIENSRIDGLNINGGEAVIDHSSVLGIGLQFARATVTSTVVAHGVGIRVEGGGNLTLESSVLRGNGVGLYVTGGIARISNSVVTQNTTGIEIDDGTVLTRRNNTVSGNGTDVVGTLTPLGGI
jgi:hypothetical protein